LYPVACAIFPDGTRIVAPDYKRAGGVDRGSFAFETPTDEEVERRRRLAEDAS
jgi:hypothetical protein